MQATRIAKRRPPRTASDVRNHRRGLLDLAKLGWELLRNNLRVCVKTLGFWDLYVFFGSVSVSSFLGLRYLESNTEQN